MKCGVAVWNWLVPPRTLTEFVPELLAEGFEAISVQPRQILSLDERELADLNALLDEHQVPVTVHAAAGAFTEELMEGLLERLGARFHAVTFDGISASRVVNSPNSITATAPGGTAGTTVQVRVNTSAGESPNNGTVDDFYYY